ncbi:uncharacterized protein LOC126176666 [Schistocerca cancellata]|uniref:uncharacterized protein LOC126176666 n=1 Tax=Schistocerca cancellata TaxID=274614 RepID=UPI002119448E|nr:uncharacterized protein LOC126176666 [Schistocerca cancellata]
MRVLARAFCRLKTTLPWVPADTKLSKLDTLRLAASYIAHLRAILTDEPAPPSARHPLNLSRALRKQRWRRLDETHLGKMAAGQPPRRAAAPKINSAIKSGGGARIARSWRPRPLFTRPGYCGRPRRAAHPARAPGVACRCPVSPQGTWPFSFQQQTAPAPAAPAPAQPQPAPALPPPAGGGAELQCSAAAGWPPAACRPHLPPSPSSSCSADGDGDGDLDEDDCPLFHRQHQLHCFIHEDLQMPPTGKYRLGAEKAIVVAVQLAHREQSSGPERLAADVPSAVCRRVLGLRRAEIGCDDE